MKNTRFYSKGPNSTPMDTQYIPQKTYGGKAFVFQTEVPEAGDLELLLWSEGSKGAGELGRDTVVTQLSALPHRPWAPWGAQRGEIQGTFQLGDGVGKLLCGGAGLRRGLGCSDPVWEMAAPLQSLSQEPESERGLSSPVWIGRASHGALLLLFSGAWNFPLCFWCGTCSPWKFSN